MTSAAPDQRRRVGILANRLKDPGISVDDYLKAGAQTLRDRNSPAQMVGDPSPVILGHNKFWNRE